MGFWPFLSEHNVDNHLMHIDNGSVRMVCVAPEHSIGKGEDNSILASYHQVDPDRHFRARTCCVRSMETICLREGHAEA